MSAAWTDGKYTCWSIKWLVWLEVKMKVFQNTQLKLQNTSTNWNKLAKNEGEDITVDGDERAAAGNWAFLAQLKFEFSKLKFQNWILNENEEVRGNRMGLEKYPFGYEEKTSGRHKNEIVFLSGASCPEKRRSQKKLISVKDSSFQQLKLGIKSRSTALRVGHKMSHCRAGNRKIWSKEHTINERRAAFAQIKTFWTWSVDGNLVPK